MTYYEEAECPNKKFHRRREILVKDLEEPFIYNCGCGCKFEWYNEESFFILEEGSYDYENEFYHRPMYRPDPPSKFCNAVYVAVIITCLAAISALGLMSLKVAMEMGISP